MSIHMSMSMSIHMSMSISIHISIYDDRLIVMAGDVSPIDVISHIPILCENKNIPYCYVRSRLELGAAAETKKPTSVVLM